MIDAKKSYFKKKTNNYYHDGIFDIIDVDEQLLKNKEIKKCEKENFLYNIIDNNIKLEKTGINLNSIFYEQETGRIVKLTDEFKIVNILGEGSFGLVVSVICLKDNSKAALKIIKKHYFHYDEIVNQEKINNDYIIKLYQCFENEEYLFILMELMEGGSLKDLIIERYNRQEFFFREDECAIIVKSIIEALDYMHLMSMVHRDIKPGNVILI